MLTWLKRRNIKQWMENDPHCHWCKKELVYFPTTGGNKLPHNFATIDHLFESYRLARHEAYEKKTKQWVVACYSCNAKRGRQALKAVPKEVRQQMNKVLEIRKQNGLTISRVELLKQAGIIVQ